MLRVEWMFNMTGGPLVGSAEVDSLEAAIAAVDAGLRKIVLAPEYLPKVLALLRSPRQLEETGRIEIKTHGAWVLIEREK